MLLSLLCLQETLPAILVGSLNTPWAFAQDDLSALCLILLLTTHPDSTQPSRSRQTLLLPGSPSAFLTAGAHDTSFWGIRLAIYWLLLSRSLSYIVINVSRLLRLVLLSWLLVPWVEGLRSLGQYPLCSVHSISVQWWLCKQQQSMDKYLFHFFLLILDQLNFLVT